MYNTDGDDEQIEDKDEEPSLQALHGAELQILPNHI